ncbi:hypothetical protein GC194_00190 [bacterium]|nr:hypothetical protein [bacterium]
MSIKKSYLVFGLLIALSGCTMKETADLASLLVGSYKGSATDELSTEKNMEIIITRISNDSIQISPGFGNLVNSQFSLKIKQDGNYIRHADDQNGLTFEAKASARRIPLKFSTNTPIQTFDGKGRN